MEQKGKLPIKGITCISLSILLSKWDSSSDLIDWAMDRMDRNPGESQTWETIDEVWGMSMTDEERRMKNEGWNMKDGLWQRTQQESEISLTSQLSSMASPDVKYQ